MTAWYGTYQGGGYGSGPLLPDPELFFNGSYPTYLELILGESVFFNAGSGSSFLNSYFQDPDPVKKDQIRNPLTYCIGSSVADPSEDSKSHLHNKEQSHPPDSQQRLLKNSY